MRLLCLTDFVRVSAKSGKWFMLKNIREKLGNSANAKDNQGNVKEDLCLYFFNQPVS